MLIATTGMAANSFGGSNPNGNIVVAGMSLTADMSGTASYLGTGNVVDRLIGSLDAVHGGGTVASSDEV